jgi:hypothetical protein
MAAGRQAVLEFARNELYGPAGGQDEVLHDPPHRRYLLGTIYPQETGTQDVEELEAQDEGEGSVGEDLADDPTTLAHEWMPSSIGMSFFIPAGVVLQCDVWGAHYVIDPEGRSRRWRRHSLAEKDDPLSLPLSAPEGRRRAEPIPIFDGRAKIESYWRPLADGLLVTVTLVNTAKGDPADVDTERTLHQVGFRCRTTGGVIREYPHVDALTTDEEDAELRLLYRKARVFAVGHGCSAVWDAAAIEAIDTVTAEFVPSYELPALTQNVASENSDVFRLNYLADARVTTAELMNGLKAFVTDYESWAAGLATEHADIPERFYPARDRLLHRLNTAAKRMRSGIKALEDDPDVLRAFRLANLAMLMQMRHAQEDLAGTRWERDNAPQYEGDYLSESGYTWYPFQLAFQLLTIESLAAASSPDRPLVVAEGQS